jgi:DNA-binding response OmpR family regulator
LNILICEDDAEIVESIAIYLRQEGYTIHKAANGAEALAVMRAGQIHLVIMDVMMPVMDGITATVKIREQFNVPIIMLSAKSEDVDKIMGLHMGADDYVSKPFNLPELAARVKSQLRRYTDLGSLPLRPGLFKTGGLTVDDARKKVCVDGEAVRLTPVEYKILFFLIKNCGMVFSIDQIYENVWDEPAFAPENTVAVHVRRIREKIEINPKEPRYLKVVWGVGYKVEQYPG